MPLLSILDYSEKQYQASRELKSLLFSQSHQGQATIHMSYIAFFFLFRGIPKLIHNLDNLLLHIRFEILPQILILNLPPIRGEQIMAVSLC